MSAGRQDGGAARTQRGRGPKKPELPKSSGANALERFHEEGKLGTTYDARMLMRLWPFVRPQARLLFASLGLLLFTAGLALTRPLLTRAAFDAFDSPDAMATLLRTGALLTVFIALEQGIAFPQMYAMQLVGARSMSDLRMDVFRFLHTRRLGFFDRTPVGRLVTRVTNDVDAIQEMFGSGALNAVGDLVRLLAIVCIMLSLDWQLSLMAFLAVPPVALLVNWTRGRIRDAFREVRVKTARMNTYLNEQVSGMAVVQAYAREAAAAREFDEINSAYRSANNRSIVLDATLDAAIEMVSSVSIACVLWWAGVHAISDRVSFGTLFAFVAYIDMFFLPIRDLSARYTILQSAMAGAERVFQLLDNEETDAPVDADAVAAAEAQRDGQGAATGAGSEGEAAGAGEASADEAVAFRDVTFAYKPGVPVLRNVSLTAKRGEKVALVGATGAGKSTVTAVLLRLYEIESGQVRVAGRDVRSWPCDELRRSFAVVPQDVFLFPGTVASNIAAGDVEPDRARVVRALTRIGALDLFERREGGLNAPILERGTNFSAGERQLIAFARALYRDPPILVLDEATANIDSDTEGRLQRALEAAMEGRTALIIAHRLSTIRAVDRIVVFHKGEVVEQGTHEELLAHQGIYARLHRLQFAKEKLEHSTAPPPGG
ncbi:MAG: ABC transporter ATP-binding protein [Polyangiaceae bacterium]